jgi:hypothetical protein
MALYAGQGTGRIADIVPAADRLRRIAAEAEALLGRIRPERGGHEEARNGGK